MNDNEMKKDMKEMKHLNPVPYFHYQHLILIVNN